MPGGVGGAVQAARFAGGLGAACCVLGSVRRGAFPSQGRVQHVPVWLLVRRRSDHGRGGCYSRRGLRSASSAGPLLLGAGLWSCWWFSPCLISPAEYGCSGQCGRRSGCVVLPNRFRRAVSGSIMQKKKPVRLDSRAGFRAVWGPDRVGLRVLHSFQRGRLGV